MPSKARMNCIVTRLTIAAPLEHRHVPVQVLLVNPAEGAEEVPQAGPERLQRVAMHLADAIAVVITGPLTARARCIAGRPSYAIHWSVFTCVIGSVTRLTTRSSVGPSEFPTTVSLTRPLSRPTTPQTGGRSLA